MLLKGLAFIFCILIISCSPAKRSILSADAYKALEYHIDSIGNLFAPDKRTTWYRIEAKNGVIKGETSSAAAKQAIINSLNRSAISYVDSITVLPEPELGAKTKGVVTLSVANIRIQPSHKAELTTQATMGTPVTVWKKQKGWYLIQTPDQYFGWVDDEAIVHIDQIALGKWQEMPKIIFTEAYGLAYDTEDLSVTVTDLVYGDVMAVLSESGNYMHVSLPDGRKGSVIRNQTMYYNDWKKARQPNAQNIISAAKRMMGVPYLWGGTSFKGVDCSGFTKTAYFMNGLVLPRDASQQAMLGEEIDTSHGWQNLQAGDLLFFGSKAKENAPERVVHVGIWIGNGEFIHASGRVQLASLDPAAANYSAGEHRRFLRAKRILPGSAFLDLRTTELY